MRRQKCLGWRRGLGPWYTLPLRVASYFRVFRSLWTSTHRLRLSFFLTMSVPPSDPTLTGDNFVLWPDGPAKEFAMADAKAIKGALVGLTLPEWVDPAEENPVSPAEHRPDMAAADSHFDSVSRELFRTTAALDQGDSTEKWWQHAEAEPAGHDRTAGLPTPLPATPPLPSVLSSDEIWALAAEEVAQSISLGAPAAPSSTGPAATLEPEDRPATVRSAGADSRAQSLLPEGPPQAGAFPSAASEASAVTAASASSEASAFPTAPVPAAAAQPESPAPESLPSAGLPTFTPVIDSWPAAVARAALGRPKGSKLASGRTGAVAPEPPIVPAPAPAVPTPSATAFPAAVPSPSMAAPVTPESAGPSVSPSSAGLSGDGPPAAAPLPSVTAAIPSPPANPSPPASRPVFSEMTDDARVSTSSGLPKRRLTGAADPVEIEVFTEIKSGLAGPQPVGATRLGSHTDASSAQGRRRKKSSRRRKTPPARSRIQWWRWVISLVGFPIIFLTIVGIMARDFLPRAWNEAAHQWWTQTNAFLFPHQYQPPRRGVQPRVGTAASPVATAKSTPNAIDTDSASGAADGTAEPAEAGKNTALPETLPEVSRPVSSGPARERRPSFRQNETTPAEQPLPLIETPALTRPAVTGDSPPAMEVDSSLAPVPAAPVVEAASETKAAAAQSAAPVGEVVQVEPSASLVSEPAAASEGAAPEALVPETAVPEGAVSEGAAPEAAAGDPQVTDEERAVRGLISATTVEEVLPWIYDAESLEPIIRGYHAEHPIEPLAEAVVELEYSGVMPATGDKAHIFTILHPRHPRGFPVSAERTPQGFRIDWQSYIQWRDGWLARFLEKKPAEPETLFVVLRRTHYFNDDVPTLEEKLSFKITSAVPGDEGAVAFVDRHSAVGRSLAELYEWRTLYFPVVELQWVPTQNGGQYLKINRVVRPTWRRVGG